MPISPSFAPRSPLEHQALFDKADDAIFFALGGSIRIIAGIIGLELATPA